MLRKIKMRNLKDLKLSKKTELRVELWLREWLCLFIEQADGKQGNVYRADFEKQDFFYFTDCNDLLLHDPEGKAQEVNSNIIRRKSRIHLQLLIKTLLGDKIGKKIKCSHCGYEDRSIDKTINGHYTFCKNCTYLTINGYLGTMAKSTNETMAKLLREAQK